MELFNMCGPFKVVLFLQLRLEVNENKQMMVYMQDNLLAQDVMVPLVQSLRQTVEFFYILRNINGISSHFYDSITVISLIMLAKPQLISTYMDTR